MMGTVVFTILAGGKVGVFLSVRGLEAIAHGMVDAAVTVNNSLQVGQSLAATPNLRKVVVKRGVCWLVIGLVRGATLALNSISVEKEHVEGDWRPVPTWQPIPILMELAYNFVGIGLVGGVMMQAHHDRRPTVMNWFVVEMVTYTLSNIGVYTPYPLIATLGTVLFLLNNTVGVYFVVMYVDRNAARSDVHNGYALLVGLSAWESSTSRCTSLLYL